MTHECDIIEVTVVTHHGRDHETYPTQSRYASCHSMSSSALDLEFVLVDAPSKPPGASKAARSRHKSKKAKKGGKPGNASNFQGARSQFLLSYLDEFEALHHSDRPSQAAFWAKVFKKYWERFPWYYDVTQDPEEVTVDPPDETDPEVFKQKADCVAKTHKVRRALICTLVPSH